VHGAFMVESHIGDASASLDLGQIAGASWFLSTIFCKGVERQTYPYIVSGNSAIMSKRPQSGFKTIQTRKNSELATTPLGLWVKLYSH